MIYRPGDFSFYRDVDFKQALEHDYKVVENNDLWTFLKNHDNGSLMFSNVLNGYEWWGGHSGSSFGCSMRIMESIAKNGWDFYVNYCLN